jgi:hypothetical protein
MLTVGASTGLCNRLDVITTGYVLASGRGEKEVEVLWPVNNQMPARFDQLFTGLPRGRVIERNVTPDVMHDYYAAVASLPPDYRDSKFYKEMLARVVANAIPEVQAEVSAFAEEHFGRASSSTAPTIGVHIRRIEPRIVVKELYPGTSRQLSAITSADFSARQLCEFAQPLRYYEAVMKSSPNEVRFFVCTDSQEAFHWLRARFGNRVFQHPKLHDNRTSVAGVREWLVELLLLSRCAAVIGTGRSSFSHISALAGGRPVVRLKSIPKIPADWPSFSFWCWIWGYRHFLMESTFWRVWLFYDVRPHAVRLARIPARCLRIARKCASKITTGHTRSTARGPRGTE